ncbi:MAG: hypothetical protein AAGA21_22135 [Pseudomonadota bacterium]
MMLRDLLGREWPEGFVPDEDIGQNTDRVSLRWLIFAPFAFLRGFTLGEGGGADAAWLWYALGIATVLIFVSDWITKIGRNRQKKSQSQRQKLDDPAPLMKVLRNYGVEELGAFYVYMPLPERPEDKEAWAWLRVLKSERLVISGPWRLEASRAPSWLKTTHPEISSDDIALYEIYRLKKDSLAAFILDA